PASVRSLAHDRRQPRPRRCLHDPIRPPGGERARQGPGRPRDPGHRRDRRQRIRRQPPCKQRPLARAGANTYVARAAVADELLRAQIEARLVVPSPAEAAIRLFDASYPGALIRAFKVEPAAPWLGNRTSGFALAPAAPAALFRLPATV